MVDLYSGCIFFSNVSVRVFNIHSVHCTACAPPLLPKSWLLLFLITVHDFYISAQLAFKLVP